MDLALGLAEIKIFVADNKLSPYELVGEYKSYKEALKFERNISKVYIYFVDGVRMDSENFRERASLFLDEI